MKARPDDAEAAQALARARDAVSALGSAIRSYNEQDYESAQRLLWDLRKQDPKNQDVEEYLFKSYFNDGVLSLQSGNTKKAARGVPGSRRAPPAGRRDAAAPEVRAAVRRTATDDLLARIYVKHVSPAPLTAADDRQEPRSRSPSTRWGPSPPLPRRGAGRR